jgi:large subunit ribosomal protein L4
MKVPLYNQEAEVVGELDLNSKIYEVKPSMHLMAESVRVQQSSARVGLAHTKTRGEVSGGGKKPWKQKGTGRARAGSTRSPIWRHGGITFGPRSNRNWELKINKKAKTKALYMSLSDKAKEGKLIVVDKIVLEPVKTKAFAKIMTGFKTKISGMGKKTLFVVPQSDPSLVRASRNLEHLKPVVASTLNIVDVLKADTLFVLKDSLNVIEKTYLKS